MTKDQDFKLLKIQTCVLKVNIHCDGCKQKVKKLLQRIEGVYQVLIDADQQKVTISGSVDSATLIKKLVRAGKYAEIWSQKSNQNQKQKNNCFKDDKNNTPTTINNKSKGQKPGIIKGLEAFKNQQQQQKFPALISSEDDDDDFYDDDDDEDDDDFDEDELRFLRQGLLRQQIDAKKNIAAVAASNNGGGNNNKMINIGNGNQQKKGNPNQNMGIKVHHHNQPISAAAGAGGGMKLNNPQLVGAVDGRSTTNDIAAMMNLAGFPGSGNNTNANTNTNTTNNNNHNNHNPNITNSASIAGFGGGFQQVQANSGFHHNNQGVSSTGFHTNPAAASMYQMMMNRQIQNQNQHQPQPQPQMMYQRSPFIPPNTGYYYNNYNAPGYYPYSNTEQPPSSPINYNGGDCSGSGSGSHMFSDENTTSSCSIM